MFFPHDMKNTEAQISVYVIYAAHMCPLSVQTAAEMHRFIHTERDQAEGAQSYVHPSTREATHFFCHIFLALLLLFCFVFFITYNMMLTDLSRVYPAFTLSWDRLQHLSDTECRISSDTGVYSVGFKMHFFPRTTVFVSAQMRVCLRVQLVIKQ